MPSDLANFCCRASIENNVVKAPTLQIASARSTSSARAAAESPGPIAVNAERSCSGMKFTWVDKSIGVGAGRSAEAAIAGTRSHNQYAARAPTAIRIGLRNSATSINATLLASVVLTNTLKTSSLTVNLLDQPLGVFNVLFA